MRVNKAHETISLSVKFPCCVFSLFVYDFFLSLSFGCIAPSQAAISLCNLMSIYHLISSTPIESNNTSVFTCFSSWRVFFCARFTLSSCFEFNRAVTADELTLEIFTKKKENFVQTSESALVLFVRCVDQSSGINSRKLQPRQKINRKLKIEMVCLWHKYQWPIKS